MQQALRAGAVDFVEKSACGATVSIFAAQRCGENGKPGFVAVVLMPPA
jgi:hypothetical protein